MSRCLCKIIDGVPTAKHVASPPISGGRRDQEGARARRTHLTLKPKMANVKAFYELGKRHTECRNDGYLTGEWLQ